MYTKSRDSEVALLKALWRGDAILCPRCQKAELTTLHKKAKRSNCDWVCPVCGEIFRTIKMLKGLPND